MKGIEESKKLYIEHGKHMIDSEFADYKDRIAVGIFGKGSECLGYDDDISKDHDFEVGFAMFLTREDEDKIGFKLYRAYTKLIKEYGQKAKNNSLYASDKFGIKIIDDYFESLLGFSTIPTDWRVWFHTPDYALVEATNGEIFTDNLGIVTDFRNRLISDMPMDVRLKKLAGHLAMAAQTGQYNFNRMVRHGETTGAQIALGEYVKHILYILFWLEDKYLPYYKWQIRAFKEGKFGYLASKIDYLLLNNNEESHYVAKKEIIEEIATIITKQLNEKGISSSTNTYLENQAIAVTRNIKQREIRGLHLMDYGE